MQRRTAILAAAVALAACDPFYAEIEQPDLCLTELAVGFPGTTPPTNGTLPPTEIELDFGSYAPLASGRAVERTVRFLGLRLEAVSGISDLDGLASFRLAAAQAPPGTAQLVLAEYSRSVPTGATLDVSPARDGAGNLADYVADGKLRLVLSGSGTLPPTGWSANVRGCFYVKVRVALQDIVR